MTLRPSKLVVCMLAAAVHVASAMAPASAQFAASKDPEVQNKVAQSARWLRICESERRVEEATCNGFIMGLEETQFLAEYKPLYCPPPMFRVEQQKEIIVKFLKANPGRHGEPFARLAVDAMRAVYPCRN